MKLFELQAAAFNITTTNCRVVAGQLEPATSLTPARDTGSISTDEEDVSFDITPIPAGSVNLPEGPLSPGDGVGVTVTGTLTSPVELPTEQPSDDAIPVA